MNKEKKIFYINESEVFTDLETKLGRKLTEKEIERARKYFGRDSGFAGIVYEQRKGFMEMFCEEVLEGKERGGSELSLLIDEEYIRDEVESYFDAYGIEREMLNVSQIEDVFYKLTENLIPAVQDSIREVIDDIELTERSENAEKTFPHYEIYWRNKNAYQNEWTKVGLFKTNEDVEEFLNRHYNTPFDECNVFKVEKNGDREFISSRGEEYGKGEKF